MSEADANHVVSGHIFEDVPVLGRCESRYQPRRPNMVANVGSMAMKVSMRSRICSAPPEVWCLPAEDGHIPHLADLLASGGGSGRPAVAVLLGMEDDPGDVVCPGAARSSAASGVPGCGRPTWTWGRPRTRERRQVASSGGQSVPTEIPEGPVPRQLVAHHLPAALLEDPDDLGVETGQRPGQQVLPHAVSRAALPLSISCSCSAAEPCAGPGDTQRGGEGHVPGLVSGDSRRAPLPQQVQARLC